MPVTLVGLQSIYYDDYGSGHPVLLIPGLGTSRFMWWKQIEIISRKYRLISMDNRDAGDSAPGTGPYTIADMADDAAGVIRNLNCGPTSVVGWSMGGLIALELSLRHPELVDKLILVATSAGGSAYIPPPPEMGVLLILKVKRAKLRADIRGNEGKIFERAGMLLLGTAKGSVELLSVQWDGKKEVDAAGFMNGLKGRGQVFPLSVG